MIPNGILTRFRRRPSYQKHTRLVGSKVIREIRVLAEPARSLFVPIRDFGAETIVEILAVCFFFWFVEQYEAVADVDEVLLRRAELAGADGAAQDNDGEEQAEDRDLAMPESSLEPFRPLSSQTLF
uniref:Uncharacterized protein n=1 Tax=Cajanus cajan TaxID=3821 RepID=A0A151S8G0_CAJCA|nr:hypothetical protein KK1_027234 [Cajanus cajan]